MHGSLSRPVGTASPSPRARESLFGSCHALPAAANRMPALVPPAGLLPRDADLWASTPRALCAPTRDEPRAARCQPAHPAGPVRSLHACRRPRLRCTFRCSPARLRLSRSWEVSSEGRLRAVLALRVRLPALSHELLELAFAAETGASSFAARRHVPAAAVLLAHRRLQLVPIEGRAVELPQAAAPRRRLHQQRDCPPRCAPAGLCPSAQEWAERAGRAGRRGVLCTASSAALSACCRRQPPLADIAHRQLDCRARCAPPGLSPAAQEWAESAGCAARCGVLSVRTHWAVGSNLVPSQSQQPVRSVGTEVLLGPHGAGYMLVTKSFITV